MAMLNNQRVSDSEISTKKIARGFFHEEFHDMISMIFYDCIITITIRILWWDDIATKMRCRSRLCLSSCVFQEQLGIGVLGDVFQVDGIHFPGGLMWLKHAKTSNSSNSSKWAWFSFDSLKFNETVSCFSTNGIAKIKVTFKSAKVQRVINLLVQIFRLCSVGLAKIRTHLDQSIKM